MSRAHGSTGVVVAVSTIVAACALLLSACAAEPIADWQPPVPRPVVGVSLVSQLELAATAPASPDTASPETVSPDSPSPGTRSPELQLPDSSGAAGEAAGSAGAADSAAGSAGAASTAPAPIDEKRLGLLPGRVKNDPGSFAARFVYVPGVPQFNARVNDELRAAITATGAAYDPQAHPAGAGLADRGCVAGSTYWPASDVLSRAATGPTGGSGTAVTCEVVGAFGDLIEVRLRVVSGDADVIDEDRTSVLFADVTTGMLAEVVDQWNESAPAELWHAAVELLRRDAGALSSAPLAEPAPEQLALAEAALVGSEQLDTGGLLVTIAPGLASAELEGLGIERTDEPTLLAVEPATVLAWSNEQYRDLHSEMSAEFAGVSASAASVPIDCSLIPCVALTYDDGPGDLTPKLLDTLRDEQARATFYMLGGRAVNNPDTVLRVVEEGHEIGSHTMSHPDLTTLPLPEAKAQVLDAAAELQRISGEPVRSFRPPYGAINDEIITEVGLSAVLWSIDTNDWRKPGKPALVERAAGGAKPGSIILFHDIHSDSVEVAADVIRALRDRGFETVTVSQLFDGQIAAGRVSAR